jgi:lysophospholipid acyltransferase (LPLAT)-like uncharacterized protein
MIFGLGLFVNVFNIFIVCFCVALSKKKRYIGIALSVHQSIRPSRKLKWCRILKVKVTFVLGFWHENLMLAITLPFLNISSSNFRITLLMTTGSRWCRILKVKVTFDGVMPHFVLEFWHENLTLAITLPFLNISSSNFKMLLLMTTRSWWWQIL